jgi:hypothetical protein
MTERKDARRSDLVVEETIEVRCVEQQRVAVWSRPCDRFGAKIAAGTAAVVYDHRTDGPSHPAAAGGGVLRARRELSPALRQLLTKQRKALYQEEHPETKRGSGGGRAKARKGAKSQNATEQTPAFIDALRNRLATIGPRGSSKERECDTKTHTCGSSASVVPTR